LEKGVVIASSFRIAEKSDEYTVLKIREYTTAFCSGILPGFVLAR
jgi:hypothetical protein